MENRRLKITAYLILCMLNVVATMVATTADNTETNPQTLYTKAQELQKKNDFTAAIEHYEKLINVTPPKGKEKEAFEPLADGLLQLMYCYIFANRTEDGANYFSRIRNENKYWIVKNSPRDINICTAYALYMAAQPDKAAILIDSTLQQPETGRNPDRLYVDYGISSVIYNQIGEIRKAIDCNKKSFDIIKTLPDKSKMVFVLGNLVYQYQQIGEFNLALAAYDSLLVSGEGEKNPYGLCAAEVNVTHLFDEWGLEDEVEIHLAKARLAAKSCKVPEALLRVDNLEASFALLKKEYQAAASLVDSMSTRLPDRSQSSFYHRFYDCYRCALTIATVKKGDHSYLPTVHNLIADLENQPLDNLSVLSCRILGDVLTDKKEYDLAIRAYSLCCNYIRKNNLLNQERHIYYSLAELYTETGNHTEATRYFQLANTANKQFTERRNAGLISQFRVKYETHEKEQQNQLLLSQVKLKQRTIKYNIVVIISLLLLSCVFALWFVMRQRTLRLQHEADSKQHQLDLISQREAQFMLDEKERQLRHMLNDRQELNRKNEELRVELEQLDARNGLQEIINSLSPRLLTAEEEQDFRRQFALIHPSFLSRLRKVYPNITRSEELLAMLIFLNMTTEEIALALGNNRASVHSSRSRLRKKLDIDKHITLEDFFKNI